MTPAASPSQARSLAPAGTLAQDPDRGVPTLYRAPTPVPARPGMSAEAAARHHLDRLRGIHGASRAAIAGARLRFVHDDGRGGIIVALRQRVGDVEVFHGDVKVLLDASHRLLAVSGAPHPAARPASARPFVLPATAAAGVALGELVPAAAGARFAPTGVTRGTWQYYTLASPAARLRRPARVSQVYYPVGDALVPAHFVELQVTGRDGALQMYQHVVSADDGRVLWRRDATDHAAFKYRVNAEQDGDHRPLDGPLEDYTPHPFGTPSGGPKLAVPPVLISMEGFNTNPNAQPDPWLPPSATETRGNNVDAYVDHSNPTGLQLDNNEFRAGLSAPNVFDWTYDLTKEPLANKTQSKAAITQLFYTTNWMHDWWYDSGFTEATGNAQIDNFGRGGVGNDPLLAEAQDAALVGTRNNANMSTPADGESPVMQMYLWTSLVKNTLTISPPDKNFTITTASFGPKNYDVTAPLVLMQDAGGMSTTDGCEDPVIDLAGKVVLIDRGSCTFEFKTAKAQSAGAVGVLIANNADGALNMGFDNNVVDPTIPAQSVLKVDGAAIKLALAQPQTAHMFGSASVERDGTIDNMIVAHEWGHFLHHRLVDCGNNQCRAMSEGWGDFNALMMSLREGDDLHATFGTGPYATFDTTAYYGLRRAPYSVSFDRNAFTFRHISNGQALPANHPLSGVGGPNSEVHNAGEVWATMMWEAYVALHEAHADLDFEVVHRMMGDYIVGGMILAPVEATFTEQRDGILLAAHAADPADALVLAEAFARRGAGSCAVSAPRTSTDFIGVVEDFELRAAGTISGVSLSDDALSCDDDGVVDVDELGTLKVSIFNHGGATMPAGALVEILDPDPVLVLPQGSSVSLPALPAFAQTVVEIPVAIDPATVDHLARTLEVRLTTPGGCTETSETFLRVDFNGDVDLESSDVDDFEAPAPAWTRGGTEEGDAVWTRLASPTGYVYHGANVGRVSDTWLESPTFEVSADVPLVLGWEHAYSFEFSDGIFWDGGVIELSEDNGATWKDIGAYIADPGYGGAINSALNPLDKRKALVDKNAAYPDLEPYTLDLGLALAGKQVKLRFRIGTDSAAGGPGWDIDNFFAEGITNTPFSAWIPDQTLCMIEEETDTDDSTTSDGTTTDGTTSTGTTGTGTTGDTTSGTTTSGDLSTGDTSTGDTSTGAVSVSSSEGSADTTATTTLDPTTGGTSSGATTEDFTTGVLTTSGGMNTSGPTPTTGGGPSSADESGDESGASSSGSGGEVVTDDGCGCRTDNSGRGLAWQLVPWLGLAALRRRRRA